MTNKWPPYSYVPGFWPHPINHPDGHAYGQQQKETPPLHLDAPQDCPPFERGVHLFEAGYYWEAHEEWERVWNRMGRRGMEADLLKGLIKLAAAAIKVRQGYPKVALSLLNKAMLHLSDVQSQRDDRLTAGIDLLTLLGQHNRIGQSIEALRPDPKLRVEKILPPLRAPTGPRSNAADAEKH